MKKQIATLFLSGIFAISNAQPNTFPSSGPVGVGTNTPEAMLHLKGTGNLLKIENPDATIVNGYSQLNLKAGGGNNFIWSNNLNSTGFFGGPGALNIYTGQLSPIAFFINTKEEMRIDGSGNVGIGTKSPTNKLHIKGAGNMFKLENEDGVSTNGFSQINLQAGTASNYIWTNNQNSSGFYGGSSALNIYTGQPSPIAFFTNTNERMRVDADGNVGIGTNTPAEKLSVNGNIRAKQVKVESVGWPDFVFEPDYRLPGLNETEQFIKANKHLPEIPSAKEVAEKGINLGEMNSKLLQKIEELTLYIIELNKKVITLEKKVEDN